MSSTDVGTEDARDGDGRRVEFVRVRIGGEAYAVESGRVGGFVRDPSLSRVPRTAPTIAGVTDVDGDVVAAIDGRALLGVEPSGDEPAPVLVVLSGLEGAQATGLLVDAVDRIETHPIEHIRPARGTDGTGLDRPGDGVIAVIEDEEGPDGTTAVFDPEGVVEAVRADGG